MPKIKWIKLQQQKCNVSNLKVQCIKFKRTEKKVYRDEQE